MAAGRDQEVTGEAPVMSHGGGTVRVDGETANQGEREREEVQEDRVLTLSTYSCSAVAEELGRRRNRCGGAADGGEEDETDASM